MEEDKSRSEIKNSRDKEKIIKKIKNIGKDFKIFGLLKIIFVFFIFKNYESLNLYFLDIILMIATSILYLVLGKKIEENIDKNTKIYLKILFWQLIAFAILGAVLIAVDSSRSIIGIVISLVLAIYASYGIKKSKLIDIEDNKK